MGKKARSARAERRKKEKRSRKAANRAQYEAWRDAGQNGKRAKMKQKRRDVLKLVSHPDGECGNPACRKCFTHIPGKGIYRNGQVPTLKAA